MFFWNFQENYVPSSNDVLSKQKPMYDTILCLSLTKWIHLNWGDEGLKLMFKRIFLNLRPGGRLILEPQPFSSYKKKKNLTVSDYFAFLSFPLYRAWISGYVRVKKLHQLLPPLNNSTRELRKQLKFSITNCKTKRFQNGSINNTQFHELFLHCKLNWSSKKTCVLDKNIQTN